MFTKRSPRKIRPTSRWYQYVDDSTRTTWPNTLIYAVFEPRTRLYLSAQKNAVSLRTAFPRDERFKHHPVISLIRHQVSLDPGDERDSPND